jgi:hypothetical protein
MKLQSITLVPSFKIVPTETFSPWTINITPCKWTRRHVPPEQWNLVSAPYSTCLTSSKSSLSFSVIVLPSSIVTTAGRRRAEGHSEEEMLRGMKSVCGVRCRSSTAPIISTSYIPFLSHYFPPLPCLFFLFLMTHACVLVPVSLFVAFHVYFSWQFVSWTQHYLTLGWPLAEGMSSPGPLSSSPIPPIILQRSLIYS